MKSITDYWFTGNYKFTDWDRESTAEWTSDFWLQGSEEEDKYIKNSYQAMLKMGLEGKLANWKDDKDGRLASIILFSQMTRAILRDTEEATSGDELALELAKLALSDRAQFDEYKLYEKAFILLPLSHSADKEERETCVKELEALIEQSSEDSTLS